MKLDINDLTNGLAKQNIVPEIKPIEPTTDFMTGFVQNVKQVMDVLDAVGVKDLFVQKARDELENRLFGHRTIQERRPQENLEKGANNTMLKPKLDIDKILVLGLAWLDKFIEKNGDIPLSQFKKSIEENKEQLVKSIKEIGMGLL